MNKLNNARLACYNCTAIYDYEPVDEARGIWRGRVMIDKNIKGVISGQPIFFSRLYDDKNDMDRMLHEYEVLDVNIKGVRFLLVPREKLLFLYEPPSDIEVPEFKVSDGRII